MKKILGIIVLTGMLATSAACDGYRDVHTSTGVVEDVECVGFWKKQNRRFEYEFDTRNVVWAVIGCAGIGVSTVVWAFEYAYCPIGEAELPVSPSAPPSM